MTNKRISLEKKLQELVDWWFILHFSFIEENRIGKKYFCMADNWKYVLPVTGSSIKNIVNETYNLSNK